MNKNVIIGSFIAGVLFVAIGLVLIKPDVMEKEVIIKKGETVQVGPLSIENRGGGHAILIEGGDLPYTSLILRLKDKEEKIEISDSHQGKPSEKFWNGYLLIVEEMGWDGESVKLLVKKLVDVKMEFGTPFAVRRYQTAKNNELEARFIYMAEIGIPTGKSGVYALEFNMKYADDEGKLRLNSDPKGALGNSKNANMAAWNGYKVEVLSINPEKLEANLLITKL
ncbi:hypothetical protein KKG36_00960 [Patescibacteria group bacterium]|nr:hypothetical protein [Patescibacteria group bacterium]